MEFSEINLKNLEINKQSDELSRMIDEWEKMIREKDAVLQIVEQSNIEVSKELVKLRNEMSEKRQKQLELESSLSKGNHSLRELKSQKKAIERCYWRAK